MLLDVGGHARARPAPRRAAVEVGVHGGQARPRPGRPGRPSASGGSPRRPTARRGAAPGAPRRISARRVVHERDRAEGGEGDVERCRRRTAGPARRPAPAARVPRWCRRRRRRAAACRRRGRRRPSARPGWPASGRGRRSAAHLQDPPAGHVAEQPRRRPRAAPPGTRRSPRRRGTRRARPGSRRRRRPTSRGWPAGLGVAHPARTPRVSTVTLGPGRYRPPDPGVHGVPAPYAVGPVGRSDG